MMRNFIQTRKPTLFALILAAGTALLCGCAEKQEPQPIPDHIQRIVSMAPSVTECLFAIGAGDRVVGVTTFCGYPDAANRLPRIGGYADANYEKIYSLKPDLVIMLNEHFAAAERLGALGIPFLKVDTSTIPDIYRTIETLGKTLDAEAGSRALMETLRKRMADIEQRTAGTAARTVLISIGRNMGSGGLTDVYVAGRNTLFNEMLDQIGARNVYQGRLDYAKMSHEAIMQLAPDVIIDLIPDLQTSLKMTPEEVQQEWRILKNVPAVKNGQVYVYGGDYVCVPGPRFIRIFEDIARAVHPECFEESP